MISDLPELYNSKKPLCLLIPANHNIKKYLDCRNYLAIKDKKKKVWKYLLIKKTYIITSKKRNISGFKKITKIRLKEFYPDPLFDFVILISYKDLKRDDVDYLVNTIKNSKSKLYIIFLNNAICSKNNLLYKENIKSFKELEKWFEKRFNKLPEQIMER